MDPDAASTAWVNNPGDVGLVRPALVLHAASAASPIRIQIPVRVVAAGTFVRQPHVNAVAPLTRV